MADDPALFLPLPRAIRRPEVHPRAPRLFRERVNPLDVFRPEQVRRKFRLWPAQVRELVNLIGDELEPVTQRSHAIPATIKVCAALRFYASGSYLDVVGDVMGLSEPSLCVIVRDVTQSLLTRRQRFIQWPQAQDRPRIMREFGDIAGKQ